MLLLLFIGEPFRILLSNLRAFKELDILQASIIDVYLGGLFLYVIALIPLPIFTALPIRLLSASFIFFSIIAHLKSIKRLMLWFSIGEKRKRVNTFLSTKGVRLLKGITVLGMFTFSLTLQLEPVSSLVFGSIHDTSLHALFVELILENGHIPATHEPYLPAAIIYPQGAHVIFSFSSLVLGQLAPKTILYVSPLFSSMTILAAYYLGKKVEPAGNLDIVLPFVMTFVSMWPAYITWGSNPCIVGFPLYLICLALLPHLYQSPSSNIREIFLIGILYGYLATIHLAFYQVVVTSAFLWLLIVIIRETRKAPLTSNFLATCVFSLLPIAPFFYRFLKYYPNPGHNIGLPSDMVLDVSSPPTPHGQPSQSPVVPILMNFLEWVSSNFNIHPDPILRVLLTIIIFIAVSISVWYLAKRRNALTVEKISLASITASIVLNLATYVVPMIVWSRIVLALYISCCILVSVLAIRFYHSLLNYFGKVFCKLFEKDRAKRITASYISVSLVFSLICGPFVSYTISSKSKNLLGLYRIYGITSESDYELMEWMKTSLPRNATILISPYESGGFIPSVSQKKVIFPFCDYLLSSSYRRLINLVQREVLNETTYKLMDEFGITHIFIGSRAVQQWGITECPENPKWDAMLFLANPNFELIKNIGDTYLFRIVNENPDIVFQENFEDLDLTERGWHVAEIGNGSYNFTIIEDGYSGNMLMVVAKKGEFSRWLYSCLLSRKVYLWNSEDVELAFDFNASCIEPPSTISISIFDADHEQYLSFATPSTLHGNHSFITELLSDHGNLNLNISDIWEGIFDEHLPHVAIIELAVVDVNYDSSTSVLFDNIAVTINE